MEILFGSRFSRNSAPLLTKEASFARLSQEALACIAGRPGETQKTRNIVQSGTANLSLLNGTNGSKSTQVSRLNAEGWTSNQQTDELMF